VLNCGFHAVKGEKARFQGKRRTQLYNKKNQDWQEVFTGKVEGQIISGNFIHTGISGQLTWRGNRAQVLTYGLVQKSSQDRQEWQERTRRQLYHLMMANNPQPIGGRTHSPGTRVRPLTDIIMNRDDNPSAHPQNYELTELFLTIYCQMYTMNPLQCYVSPMRGLPSQLLPFRQAEEDVLLQ
jgi:hypothetical protein